MCLTNFKALGISKCMDDLFNEINKTDLTILLESEYFKNPSIQNRNYGLEYCEVEVLDCQNENWWYKKLIGFRFFCEIKYKDFGYGRFIDEFIGVKLTCNKKIVFRSFSPKDVTII